MDDPISQYIISDLQAGWQKNLNQIEARWKNRGIGDFSNLHGEARYSDPPHDLRPAFAPNGCDAVPLGYLPSTGKGFAWILPALKGHAMSFGITRSGKGTCSIIPALLTYMGSMVVIDPKGENAWITGQRRREMGHRVVILDPWGEVNRRFAEPCGGSEEVTRFNPLSALRADDEDFADDVAALADALIISTPGGHDAHWTESARELVAGLIAAEVERKPPGKASLESVRRLLTATDEELAETVKVLHEARPDSLGGRKLRRFTKATDEIAGIRSTAETQTAILDNARLAAAMETDDPPFDLGELATGKVTLFLVLPLDRLQTHGRWLRVILTLAIRAIARHGKPLPLPCLFMLDEMGTIGKLPMVEQAYGLMSGIDIRIWGFMQDLSQLKRDYPDSWETFISNSDIIELIKANDVTTCEYISNLLGTYTRERISGETAAIRNKGGNNAKYSSMSDQVFARPLALPQELRALPQSLKLVIVPAAGNYILARMPYYERDEWIDRYRPPPGRKMKERPVAPPPPEPPKPIIDTERAAELAAQGLAVGKMAAGKAAGWAAGKFREMQQRQAGAASPPPDDKEPPPTP